MTSTPTLFNSGTTHAQMSSCYLLDSPMDDLRDIEKRYNKILRQFPVFNCFEGSYSDEIEARMCEKCQDITIYFNDENHPIKSCEECKKWFCEMCDDLNGMAYTCKKCFVQMPMFNTNE